MVDLRRDALPGVLPAGRTARCPAVRHELYVDAARVSGLSDARIIARHILTVVRAPAIIQAASVAGIAIADPGRAGLPRPRRPEPSHLGRHAQRRVRQHLHRPAQLLWPSLAIGLTLIALALFGNALRDELERSRAPRTTPAQAQAGTPSHDPEREPVDRARRAGGRRRRRDAARGHATSPSATTSPTARSRRSSTTCR